MQKQVRPKPKTEELNFRQLNNFLNIFQSKGSFLHRLFPLFFVFIPHVFIGQNLIENGKFESYQSCPNQIGQISKAFPWVALNTGTPDFFHNNCPFADSENSLDEGSIGLIIYCEYNDAIEYFGQKLKSPLTKGWHTLSFDVKAKNEAFFSNNLGVIVQKGDIKLNYWGAIHQAPIFNIDSAISNTEKWLHHQFNFYAQGGENFVAFGNFLPPEKIKLQINNQVKSYPGWVTYCFIDNISLRALNQTESKPEAISTSLRVFFNFDSFEVSEGEKEKIKDFLSKHYTNQTINLAGHTDSLGSTSYNQKLSAKRNQSVQLFIQSLYPMAQCKTENFGALQPSNNNRTDTNRALNRRVEIEFLHFE